MNPVPFSSATQRPSSCGFGGGGDVSQAAAAARAAAAALSAATNANMPGSMASSGQMTTLTVTGCGNPTVSNIISGTYSLGGSNHDRPVYKKEGQGSVSVLIYFWDDRDGPSFSGWWFGPKVGGDQVWAYNGDKSAQVPPLDNWQVPWDGPADPSLRLIPAMSVNAGAQRPSSLPPLQHSMHQQSMQQPMQSALQQSLLQQSQRPSAATYPPPPMGSTQMQNSQQPCAAAARFEEERRAAEERRRQEMLERQKAEAERHRLEAERRRAAEEQRKEEEERLRKEADAKRRSEQQAALAVRKVIQRVRVATPETYDNLRVELEEAQSTHLEALGSQAEKVSQEAEQTLQQAQRRIDEINMKREEEERRRLEDERRAKEDEEKVQRLLKEVSEEVKVAEGVVRDAQDAAKALEDDGDREPEATLKAADETAKVIEACKESLEKHIQIVDEKWNDMGSSDAARKVRREMDDLHGNMLSGRRTLERLSSAATSARDGASRKAAALRKQHARKEFFAKHDHDNDGQLSKEEVTLFAKAEFDGFEVPEDVLANIMRLLEPVTFEKFHAMHVKVGIARSEAKARIRRAEEKARRQRLDEERRVVQTILDEAEASMRSAEDIISRAEDVGRPLTQEDATLSSEAIEKGAAESDSLAKQAESELVVVQEKLKGAEEACNVSDDLRGFDQQDAPQLRERHDSVKARLDKVVSTAKKSKERAVRKAYAEMDQKRLECATAIRTELSSQGKSGEDLFASIGNGEPLTSDKFAGFIKGLSKLELGDGEAEKLVQHIAGEAGSISKEQFLELIRLYYKCVKATVLNEDISIKSKQVRKLEVGEVVEVFEGPLTEDAAGVTRIRCQAVQDEAMGWVTISGNQGTPFLEPGGNLCIVVKDTLLTDCLSITDSKTIRRLAKGEVIEVLEFQKKDDSVDVKRIKGKCKLDGATGWVTVASNQGTPFIEPC